MKNFLFGAVVGTALGYVFHGDIEKALRQGLDKANQAAGPTPETTP